jgi:hypothetical protein
MDSNFYHVFANILNSFAAFFFEAFCLLGKPLAPDQHGRSDAREPHGLVSLHIQAIQFQLGLQTGLTTTLCVLVQFISRSSIHLFLQT